MKRSPTILVHVLLATTGITPQEREGALANISQNAPKSDLAAKEPTVKQAVVDLGPLGTTYTTAKNSVAVNAGLLEVQKQALETARAALARALILLSGLVENRITTNDEAVGMGFAVVEPASKANPIAVPDGVSFTPGKKHGQFAVEAIDQLKRKHFAAQISTDPIGPNTWTDLPGHGKRRRLAGYTPGTTLWVRFAALRGQTRGDWCAARPIVVL